MEVAPPGAILSGWAAAVVHGVPESHLSGRTGTGEPLPVPFSVARGRGLESKAGCQLRQTAVCERHTTEIDGIQLTSAHRTALDLTRWCKRDGRRLAMLDTCLRFGLVTTADLGQFVAPLGGLHGLAAVRALLPLATGLAESVWESELRMVWLAAGLPAPLANPTVYDRFGRFLARTDLLDPENGVVGEYEGWRHRVDGAAELDRARIARLAQTNLTVVEIWKEDFAQHMVIAKLNDGYRRARARDRRLDSWTWRSGEVRLPG